MVRDEWRLTWDRHEEEDGASANQSMTASARERIEVKNRVCWGRVTTADEASAAHSLRIVRRRAVFSSTGDDLPNSSGNGCIIGIGGIAGSSPLECDVTSPCVAGLLGAAGTGLAGEFSSDERRVAMPGADAGTASSRGLVGALPGFTALAGCIGLVCSESGDASIGLAVVPEATAVGVVLITCSGGGCLRPMGRGPGAGAAAYARPSYALLSSKFMRGSGTLMLRRYDCSNGAAMYAGMGGAAGVGLAMALG